MLSEVMYETKPKKGVRNLQPTITVRIKRWNPEDSQSRFQSYEVPHASGMSVMDVLKYIQYNLDSSLTFYCSCKVGLCRGCSARVNDQKVLLCATSVTEASITIEPIHKKVFRDLI